MKILVAGAHGQVATELARQATATRHALLTLGRQWLDIQHGATVLRQIEALAPDIVINAAAYTAVDRAESEREAAWAVNCDGVGYLAAACRIAAIPLLHISTDYVFDGTQAEPYVESDPVAPLGVYGESKWMGEERLRQSWPNHLILRTSWVFAAHGHNFVKTMLRLAADRSTLRVVADQFGGPTSAAGIAAALLQICDRYAEEQTLPWGTYHFSGQPFTSWHGFATEIIRLATELNLIDHPVTVEAITTADYPTPARRPANSRLDSSRLTQQLGIAPDDWQSALRALIERANCKIPAPTAIGAMR